MPNQTSLDLADDHHWYSASWALSRAWSLTPAMSREVTVLDNTERFQSGLPHDCVDAGPIL